MDIIVHSYAHNKQFVSVFIGHKFTPWRSTGIDLRNDNVLCHSFETFTVHEHEWQNKTSFHLILTTFTKLTILKRKFYVPSFVIIIINIAMENITFSNFVTRRGVCRTPDSAVAWGTALQARRPRVQSLMIDLIFPATILLGGRLNF